MNIKKTRDDFPILDQDIAGKPPIYFDNAAMTLKPRQVVEAMCNYYNKYCSISGRSVHKFAVRTNDKVNESRETIRRYINAPKKEQVIFTRNTTESLNLLAYTFPFKSGDRVITSDREHNSNLVPWLMMREKRGIKHEVVKSNEDGTFNLDDFEKMMARNVKLVSVVHTSNLDGYTLPVREIIEISHDYGARVCLDSAQAAGHQPIDVKKLDVDFLAFSIHKMCGPTGMGIFYAKEDFLKEAPGFMVGGDTVQETTYDSYTLLPPPEKFEAGLQNYAGIIGAGAAADYISRIGFKDIQKQEHELNMYISERLWSMPKVTILGPREPEKRSAIVSFTVDGLDVHDVAIILDEMDNIMIRSGMHCGHSWFKAHGINGSDRASLYFYNTLDEAEIFCDRLEEAIEYLS